MLLFTGCHSEPTAEVSGTVTLDGRPLPYGTVTFYPQANGKVAYGTIEASGNYELTSSDKQGISPGEYRVVITAVRPLPSPVGQGLPIPGQQLVPPKFTQLATTVLRFTLSAGPNRIDLPLRSPRQP